MHACIMYNVCRTTLTHTDNRYTADQKRIVSMSATSQLNLTTPEGQVVDNLTTPEGSPPN